MGGEQVQVAAALVQRWQEDRNHLRAIQPIVGPEPFRAFVEYELPRLSSGELFRALR